jgi:hypothetical protein
MAPKIDPKKIADLVGSVSAPLVLGGGLLMGGLYGAGNCLYNVDAGMRAIKFSRWSGVMSEVRIKV